MKTKAHTRYTDSTGKRVSSVTTVIGESLGWNKNMLIAWARREGMAGRDPHKVRDEAAEIGTLAHTLCENRILGKDSDMSDYTPNQQKTALICFTAFCKWEKEIKPEYLATEVKLVSEKLKVGGTFDGLYRLDGNLILYDLKSSKGVYDEMIIQLGAYTHMYEEMQPKAKIESAVILRLDKENGGFEHHDLSRSKLNWGFKAFKLCLDLYKLKRSK
tara:strand:+ start:169 stop:816 length:648 start_codon:yes stop_codon:yes gene_type:complete